MDVKPTCSALDHGRTATKATRLLRVSEESRCTLRTLPAAFRTLRMISKAMAQQRMDSRTDREFVMVVNCIDPCENRNCATSHELSLLRHNCGEFVCVGPYSVTTSTLTRCNENATSSASWPHLEPLRNPLVSADDRVQQEFQRWLDPREFFGQWRQYRDNRTALRLHEADLLYKKVNRAGNGKWFARKQHALAGCANTRDTRSGKVSFELFPLANALKQRSLAIGYIVNDARAPRR